MLPRLLRLAFALLVSAVALLAARSADAQCSASTTSCTRCHEAEGARPVLSDGSAWHRDHAYGDVCVACHSGDSSAATKEEAHTAMRPPLADPQATCGACHDDATDRARAYVAVKSASPPNSPSPPSPPSLPPRGPHRGDKWISLAIALVAVLGGAFVVHRERALPAIRVRDSLRRLRRSPAVMGAGLGVVAATSIVFLGRPLSASGAFDRLAGFLGRALVPHSAYWRFVVPPAIDASVWLIIGVLLGAFFSAAIAGTFRIRTIPAHGWSSAFGTSRVVRALVAFLGGATVQFSAGIAGGCTSGLAISGGVVLAPAAFLFMMGMFAGGVPTAWLAHRRRGAS